MMILRLCSNLPLRLSTQTTCRRTLLSTFTGLLTLGDLDALEMIDDAAALRYARSLQQPCGGFLGAAWDEQVDVEYTFYGIGSCALVTAAHYDQ